MKKRHNLRSGNGQFVKKRVLPTPILTKLLVIAALISLFLLAGCTSSIMPTITSQASLEAPCDRITPLPEGATYRQLTAAYLELVYQYQSCADR